MTPDGIAIVVAVVVTQVANIALMRAWISRGGTKRWHRG